jgi:decaprenylphospho-beta-D-erythro-pentofuranosid-2-ulose 2-reductase
VGEPQSLLVLGGSSEIGLAIARALVRRRARRVLLAARDPAGLAPAAAELQALGAAEVETLRFDAAEDAAAHAALVEQAFAGGDLDVVLVAAGLLGDQEAAARDAHAARRLVEVNLLGLVSVIVPAVERLRAQGHGTLVVLSSVAAERPRRANFPYAAAKAGLDAYAQGLGDALAGTGVQVLVVRPGFVHTKMTAGRDPAPFATTPEAVAEAVLAGLARGAHTVWAPGVLRWAMAVLRHLPRPLWRRIES